MIEKTLKIYQSTKNKINALSYAMYMINWDSETEAPVGCLEERSKQLGNITEMIVSLSHKKTYVNALKDIIANKDKVDEITWLSASKEFEELEKELKVPSKELVNYQILLATSGQTWLEAKQTNNYKHFAPKLDKIITWQKKYQIVKDTMFYLIHMKKALQKKTMINSLIHYEQNLYHSLKKSYQKSQ